MGQALERWRAELEAWAIPEEILARAPESPWGFPVGLFQAKAASARAQAPTPSSREALRSLPPGGTVLDVGSGAGAASLPLAGRAGRIVAVDESAGMLAALRTEASALGVAVTCVQGRWPDVAAEVEPADVVVCHDVLYNVPDLGPFAAALTGHARHRVVAQLTERHPLVVLNPLWRRFHGLERPEGPSADDAAVALRTLGLQVERQDWAVEHGGTFERFDDLVAYLRRRLCLPKERDPEVAAAIASLAVQEDAGWRLGPRSRQVVTLSWPGTA